MAQGIQKRISKNGIASYRDQIRQATGFPQNQSHSRLYKSLKTGMHKKRPVVVKEPTFQNNPP